MLVNAAKCKTTAHAQDNHGLSVSANAQINLSPNWTDIFFFCRHWSLVHFEIPKSSSDLGVVTADYCMEPTVRMTLSLHYKTHNHTAKREGKSTSVKVSSHISQPSIPDSISSSLKSLGKSFKFKMSSKEDSNASHPIPTISSNFKSLPLDCGTASSSVSQILSSVTEKEACWQQGELELSSCFGRMKDSSVSSRKLKSTSVCC